MCMLSETQRVTLKLVHGDYKGSYYVCIQGSFQIIYRVLLTIYGALLYVYVLRDF